MYAQLAAGVSGTILISVPWVPRCRLPPASCRLVPQRSRKGKYPQGNAALVSSEQNCGSHLLKSPSSWEFTAVPSAKGT